MASQYINVGGKYKLFKLTGDRSGEHAWMVCRADQKPHMKNLGYNTCMGIIAHDIQKYNLELIIITHILIMHLNKVN